MDWSLIIFTTIIVFFTYRGYTRGILNSLSRFLSLLAGYIAAILYTSEVSAMIESEFQLKGIAGFISASLLLFFGAFFVVTMLFKLIEKLRPLNDDSSAFSAYGGAVSGAIVGVLIGTVIIWTFAFARDMRSTDALPETSTSSVEALASQIAGNVVKTVLSLTSAKPEVARLSIAIIESPAQIAQQAKRLSRSKDLSMLLNDSGNQKVLNTGDARAVQNLPAFQQLAKNPDMRALAKSTGLLDATADNPASVEVTLANKVTDIWARTQRVKNHKRVQEILNDPEFIRKIQSGDAVDLLSNSKLLELADIILADSPEANKAKAKATGSSQGTSDQAHNGLQDKPEKTSKIYTWTDSKGVIHISDVDPKL